MSQLSRRIDYDEQGDPVLIIWKQATPTSVILLDREQRTRDAYRIRLYDAYQFSEDHYPQSVPCLLGFSPLGIPMVDSRVLTFEQFMYFKTMELIEVLGLGPVKGRKNLTRVMADIANTIEAGLDDLLKAKPQKEHTVCVGEVVLTQSDLRGEGSQSFRKDLIVPVREPAR